MFKFLMKKLLASQVKNLPKEQQDAILAAFERDPKFFQDLADDIKKEVKAGKSQQNASMIVMMRNKDKLRDLMQGK